MAELKHVFVLGMVAVLAAVLVYFVLAPYAEQPVSACNFSEPPADLNLPKVSPELQNGMQAPLFNATDIDGGKVVLSSFRGQVVVVNFMGTWCQACVWEAGRLVGVYNTYSNRGLKMLSISVEPDNSTAKVREFRSKYCTGWQFILDNKGLVTLYKAENLPTTYVIDRSGYIVYGHVGIIDTQELSSEINRLLN
ncbi:MAG: TlpA family protein disulfide reductase [Thaumarchaeota archaeon]|nr:TlpA family protein disulfide reductase [Nitrososphaerota archaeon]MCL5317901.1 TlpA family protein disulfide reductase [Nitrososphaerota archaeon]